jgi:hypothetical protein
MKCDEYSALVRHAGSILNDFPSTNLQRGLTFLSTRHLQNGRNQQRSWASG